MSVKLWKNKWFRKVLNIVVLFLFITLMDSVKAGVIGFVAYIIIFTLVIYAFKFKEINDQVLFAIRSVETHIFGKPLDDEFWSEGEWKKRKQSKQQSTKSESMQQEKCSQEEE